MLKECSVFLFMVKQSFFSDCLTVKMKAIWSVYMLESTYPVTQHHITEDLSHQQHHCEQLKSHMLGSFTDMGESTMFWQNDWICWWKYRDCKTA